MDNFLETRNLHRFFGGLHAVNAVSVKVKQGQIKAVIGPNGAGKSTFFNLIAGAICPQQGHIFFRNKNITSQKSHVVAGMGIARTFQTTRLFGQMTILENIMVGRHLRMKSGFLACMLNLPHAWRQDKESKARALDILKDFSLLDTAHEIASNLPFGRQRIVEIARSLAMEPQLLLLDEPAAGLNIYETKELAELILKIRDRGVTCLVVEHDMSLVMNISDEVVVLDQGVKIAEGPPRTIQRNPDVIRIYLGEDYAANPQS
jgi:branched-chain amino acid transport system ATP-binding protein